MPRRDTTEGLLAKFEKVDVTQELNIKEADLGYCKRQLDLYSKTIHRISNKEHKIQELSDELGVPADTRLKFTRGGSPYKEVEAPYIGTYSDKEYEKYGVHLLHALKYAHNQMVDARHKFVNNIVRYFEAEYNLKIGNVSSMFFWDEDKQELKEAVHYAPIVRAIIKECGTFDLKEVGVQRAKEHFRDLARYKERIKISNKKLIIADMLWFSESWSGIKWEYSDAKLNTIIEGLTLFETGEIGSNCPELKSQHGEVVNFKTPYDFDFYAKVVGMKVYKNGRVDFIFDSKASVYEFYEFFEFDKLDETRGW